MSDQWGPTNSDDGEWARPDAPPPPPSIDPVEPALTLDTEQAVTSGGGGRGRLLAGLVGVLVLLGGTVFAATQLGSSGPASAEEAVRELLDAASDEDVLGAMAALDPGERDALRQPMEDLFAELERLEVVGDDFDLGGVAGIDLEFQDVELRSEPVRDDLVRVYFTGGTVTAGVNGEELPLGDFVYDVLERFDANPADLDESETTPIEDDETFLVARNGDDGWRVSIGYTAAEAARLEGGLPVPAGGLTPIGAGSPEEAVEGMLRSIADLDLGSTVARLSPGEMAALQDYAPLFLDDAQAALDEGSADVDIRIDDIALRSETSGDRASVFVERFAVTVTVEGEAVSVAVDGTCLTVSGALVEEDLEGTPFADGPVCADDLAEAYDDMLEESGFEAEGFEMPEFPPFETPELGISTARIDGDWYVAPVATYLDGTVDVLRILERAHLDAIVDMVEQFFTAFSGGFEESFEEIGEPLDGDFYEAPEPLLPGPFGDDEESDVTAGTTLEPGTASGLVDEASVHAIATELAGGDPEATTCVERELWLLDEFLLYELVDAWEYEYEPSPETQEAVLTALETCGLA